MTTNASTIETLKAMRMSSMASELENQLNDPAFKQLGFEERLGLMVDASGSPTRLTGSCAWLVSQIQTRS